MESMLENGRLRKLFEHADAEIAEDVRVEGCRICGSALHRSDYDRKPRGFGETNEFVKRISFCCEQDGCRKRYTPPSLRFFGRRVYEGVIVVLLTAMTHGVNDRRAEELREQLGLDRRTLERWRQWWLETFPRSVFWRDVKGRFPKGIDHGILPLSLVEEFGAMRVNGLCHLMKFLSPISVGRLVMAGA